MKMLECYIENFGKLHQFTYKFEDGLNTINELNGWGKSTFAAFIRAMFYGTDLPKAKDSDRRKYMPWQGGKFGGYLIFEVNDKEYKIERFFADKIKDDSFILYNQKTGLVSSDFTKNIGEEIFKLDKASYSRSTYIPQNAITIDATDSINAKLSNLIENENDINNYDSAKNKLEKASKEYVKNGSKGRLDIIRNRITLLERDLESCLAKGEAAEEWNNKLGAIFVEKKEKKEKLQNIKSQIEAASKYEAQITKLQQYNELCGLEKKLQADFEPLKSFFRENVPTDEDIVKCDEKNSNLLKIQGELKTYQLTDYEKFTKETLENYFSMGLPGEKELNDCEELIAKYRENKIKIHANELTETEKRKKAELDNFFEKGVPTELEIDQFINKIPKINELKGNITTEKSKLEILKNIQIQNVPVQENKIKTSNIIMTFGIVIAILGIIMMFVILPVGIGCILSGVALFIASLIINKNEQTKKASNIEHVNNQQQDSNLEIKKFIDNLTAQKDLIEEELNNFLRRFSIEINPDNYYSSLTVIKTKTNEYSTIDMKLSNKEDTAIKIEQNDIIKRIDSYLEAFYDDLSIVIEQKDSLCKNIRNKRIEYIKINDKHFKYLQLNETFEELKSQLLKFLKTYFIEIDNIPSRNINTLKENRKEYQRLSKELNDYKIKKDRFEKDNNIELLKNIVVPEFDLKELQENEKLLDSDLDKITAEEHNASEQIRSLSDDADRCIELQSEVDQLGEELNASEAKLDILNKTLKCLEDAKNNFSTHYMDSMNQGFERYIKMLDNDTLGKAHIDVNFNVNVSEYGSQKSLDYFSTGYKDLIGIATRFALVEALFENEKPFIILDDPFTNLDGEKLYHALRIIEEIAKKYQIIYFVCHESRAVKVDM